MIINSFMEKEMCQSYKKNDLVTVTIEDIGTGGEGIGKVNGFTLFVKDAVVEIGRAHV